MRERKVSQRSGANESDVERGRLGVLERSGCVSMMGVECFSAFTITNSHLIVKTSCPNLNKEQLP
jgi:hypothetical protein